MTTNDVTPENVEEILPYDKEDYKLGRVVNYILDKADEECKPITNMKLQKLVYMAHGWALAFLGEGLFEDKIEAWEHGPVVPSLYHEFKHFGWNRITDRCVQFHPYQDEHDDPQEPDVELSAAEQEVIDLVWDEYKDFTASHLRRLTHVEGGPWDSSRYPSGQDNPQRGRVIGRNEIQKYFVDRLADYRSNTQNA